MMDAQSLRLEALRLGVQLAVPGHWESIGQRLEGAVAAAKVIEDLLAPVPQPERQPDGMGGFVPDELGEAIDAALGLAGVRRTETAPTPETMQPTPRSAAPVLPDQQSADRSPPTPSDAGQG